MKNPKWVLAGKRAATTKRKNEAAIHREYRRRFAETKKNAKWAVTMAKVRIRQAVLKVPWPRWHLLTFPGPSHGESRGVVDMIAIRKDHSKPYPGTQRGDTFQIILIQVKGGQAAMPTQDDLMRLRKVAKRHGACGVLLAMWQKGRSAQFFALYGGEWVEVDDLTVYFGKSC